VPIQGRPVKPRLCQIRQRLPLLDAATYAHFEGSSVRSRAGRDGELNGRTQFESRRGRTPTEKVRHYLTYLSDETEEGLTKDFESLKLEVDGVQRQMVALRASYAAKEDSGATFTLVPGTPSPLPFS
jgi:hypothetical protein